MSEQEKSNIELTLERIANALESIKLQLEIINRNDNIKRASNDQRKNH